MGFVKETKAATASSHAARSAQEGHSVLLYRFDVPSTSSGFSGPVSGAAEVIEAIERQGWQLDHFAFDHAQSKNGAVVLLFRRAKPPAAAPAPPMQYGAQPTYGQPELSGNSQARHRLPDYRLCAAGE
jgi:hypothetical protein